MNNLYYDENEEFVNEDATTVLTIGTGVIMLAGAVAGMAVGKNYKKNTIVKKILVTAEIIKEFDDPDNINQQKLDKLATNLAQLSILSGQLLLNVFVKIKDKKMFREFSENTNKLYKKILKQRSHFSSSDINADMEDFLRSAKNVIEWYKENGGKYDTSDFTYNVSESYSDMVIYDKASWHIDAGMNKQEVIQRLQKVFDFLNENDMLSDEGKEQYENGIDESCSLNERMVNARGNKFLKECYNDVMNNDADSIFDALNDKLKSFVSESYYDHEIICKILKE